MLRFDGSIIVLLFRISFRAYAICSALPFFTLLTDRHEALIRFMSDTRLDRKYGDLKSSSPSMQETESASMCR